ncbi:MAG: branched-chain amino acid ABC transporter permease, partial [Lachnospiraceae bacterium]|nr:branched-chain amino acid ABC transporter permease [Lachnospiraceae bacterium]
MSFITYVISGISLGSVYAIIALGYSMVYGIAKMLNFAHGDVIMVGGFVVYSMTNSMGMPPLVSVICSIIFCTVLGVLIERIAYRPLRNAASSLAVLITAIGISYFLQNIALIIYGSSSKVFSSVVSIPPLKLAGGALFISGETIVTVLACIVIMVGPVSYTHHRANDTHNN